MAPSAPVVGLQRVFTFGKNKTEGNKAMKELLGGKGANLAEMASIGLSVPPGFTVSTEACQQHQESDHKMPSGLWDEIMEGIDWVQKDMGTRLGIPRSPCLSLFDLVLRCQCPE